MRALFFFEVAPPLRIKPKVENIGALRRLIWLWFSCGYIRADFNMMLEALREDSRTLSKDQGE